MVDTVIQRFVNVNTSATFTHAEAVVEVPQAAIATWALELDLLLKGLCQTLLVQTPNRLFISIQLQLGLRTAARARVLRVSADKLRFELSRTEVEYLHAVFLRAYRDGAAEVNHIHVECELDQHAFDLTFMFDASKPAMSPEEAAKLMGD